MQSQILISLVLFIMNFAIITFMGLHGTMNMYGIVHGSPDTGNLEFFSVVLVRLPWISVCPVRCLV